MNLFDWSEQQASRAARDRALGLVEAHASRGFKEAAEEVVRCLAAAGVEFTSDDVWAAGLPPTHERRALGPVLMRLARAGVVERVGFRQTTQESRHAAPVAVWRGVRP